MNSCRLILFLKAPRLGFVKSRLAASIGEAAALQAYQTLVDILIKRLSKLPATELRFTPDDAFAEVSRWLLPGWTAAPQLDGDLGARLNRAFNDAFKAGCDRVVVIGSDCPTVTADDIESAWQALETHEVVLGPATDGGYWLIGLRRSQPQLFTGIAWSTPQVFTQTVRRVESLGLSVHRLQERSDVDTESDWLRVAGRISE
ncbi:MAG: glycosyltransferase [Pedosphaera sp.]|nr:glycosyltransferase [Pedosphaera sp.]